MPSKKTKTKHAFSQAAITDLQSYPGRDLFSNLPLELLAEILTQTSLEDVLSVARCSKHLCHTLVNNKCTEFIWRTARNSCVPALPKPTPNFTEASFAALLFDYGKCDVCGDPTKEPLHSFSLRIRICRNPRCCVKLYNEKLDRLHMGGRERKYYAIRRWLPALEYRDDQRSTRWPSFYRKSDCDQATSDLEAFLKGGKTLEDYIVMHSWDAKKRGIILDFSLELKDWWSTRAESILDVMRVNRYFASNLAKKRCWNSEYLTSSPTYQAVAKLSERRIKALTYSDIEQHLPMIEMEVTRYKEKKLCRQEEGYRTERCKLIEKTYRNLENRRKRTNWPMQLSIFRQLPIVKSLEAKMGLTREQLQKKLNDAAIRKSIDLSIESWKEEMEGRFSKMLRVPKKRFIDPDNPKKVKVVYRASSRFLCRRCSPTKAGQLKQAPESLSFVEACRHRCRGLDKKQRKEAVWKSDQFVADFKAVSVVRQVLTQIKKEDDEVRISDFVALGNTILCKSCKSDKILLNYDTLVQHCHRHERMEVKVLDQESANAILGVPVKHGYTSDLYGRRRSAQKRRERCLYICRHCPPTDKSTDRSESAPGIANLTKGEDKHKMKCAKRKMFSFDGLRSHAKTCHGIQFVADEDYIVSTSENNVVTA